MTLSKLIKLLSALEAQGHGRKPVAVDKDSLWDGNGTFSICDVKSAEVVFVSLVDGDGFLQITKAGYERGTERVIIKG